MSHDEIKTVLICMRCGRGFLAASGLQPGNFDTSRTWAWLGAGIGGEQCGGRVLDVPKNYQQELIQDEQDQASDN